MSGNLALDPHVAFGRALRKLRLAAGLSQEKLGLEADVQRNFVSLIETGQNKPTITTVFKLARALGIKASDLVVEAELEMAHKPKGRRPTSA